MNQEIPVTEARAQLSDLINRVGFGKERIVLTRHGKPLVALVPAEVLEELDEGGGAAAAPMVLDISSQASSHGPNQLAIAAQGPVGPDAR